MTNLQFSSRNTSVVAIALDFASNDDDNVDGNGIDATSDKSNGVVGDQRVWMPRPFSTPLLRS